MVPSLRWASIHVLTLISFDQISLHFALQLSFSSSVSSFRHALEFFLSVSPSCQMNAKLRPSFSQIVVELERRQAERKQKDEPAVKGESSNAL